jgi:hypothetical protein
MPWAAPVTTAIRAALIMMPPRVVVANNAIRLSSPLYGFPTAI